ncbi:MAG: S8 family serine peptidase [Alphaproteobacteria bacterium]|nr:S8 family serine peptidase [Alphaproteobacteria bacterium]
MAQIGERVRAVITSRSMDDLEATDTRTPSAAMLDDARFIAQVLVTEGFELLNFHPVAISFGGSSAAFERVFGLRLLSRTFAGGRGRLVAGFDVESEDAHRLSNLPAVFQGRAGKMAIARPPRLIDDAGAPVRDVADAGLAVWSLPDELAISIWAGSGERPAATGYGVVAAQIGTGHYRHRFFSDRGYRVLPTLLGPGQQYPQRDDHGHGTGEAACLFGAAPDLRLRPIKGLLDPVGDLLMTVDSAPTPNLIINSWGYDVDQGGWDDLEQTDHNLFHYLKILEAALAFATARGIVVCASAPRTWKSFPACHPDVIAIAAAFRGRAAQQASRGVGASGLYPGRLVPDIWSDAAKSVRAGLDLIGCTHPAQPGSALAWPESQEDSADEGFAWCDIEQAAAPLAAGRLALLLEQYPGLSPTVFRAMVTDTAEMPASADLEPARQNPEPIETSSCANDPLPKLLDERTAYVGRADMGSLAGQSVSR